MTVSGTRAIWVRILLVVMAVVVAGPVAAQIATTPPPVRRAIDDNGVDVVNGTFNYSQRVISIGSESGALSFTRYLFDSNDWNQAKIATINQNASTATVTLNGVSDGFSVSGTTYTPTEGNGATLVNSGTTWTYTSRDGAVVTFQKNAGAEAYYEGDIARATTILLPDGTRYAFSYTNIPFCHGGWDLGECLGGKYRAIRLDEITSNRGYQLRFTYARNDLPDVSAYYDWNRITSIVAVNNAVDCVTCSLTQSWPTATLARTADGSGEHHSITDAGGSTTVYTKNGSVYSIKRPGSTSADISATYTSGKVSSVTIDGVTTTYAYSDVGSTRTTTVTAPGSAVTVYTADMTKKRLTSVQDELGRTTSYTYDGSGRRTRITYDEGNYVNTTYDGRGNATETRAVAKSGSGLADIVATAVFPSTCTNTKTCNKPTSTTDARGKTTDYTYDSTHGGVLTVTAPAMPNSVRPQTRTSYTILQAYYKLTTSSIVASGYPIYLPTQIAACQTTSSCTGGADETKTTISYGPQTAGTANNLLPVSTTTGSTSLNVTTAAAWDTIGDLLTVDGPLSGTADTVRYRYDSARRRIGEVLPDPDAGGSRKHPATRYTYNGNGQVTKVERGTVDSQSDAHWAAFSVSEVVNTTYDSNARRVKDTLDAGGSTLAAVQYSYDSRGRLECTASRMNTAVFGSLPSSACTLGTTGSVGPDRIAKTTYNAASEATAVAEGYGTAGVRTTVTSTYTDNGRQATVTDAEGNKTTYEYDGHDRLLKTRFPSPTTDGVSSTTDYEQLTYDAGGNVTSRRLRDGTSIGYTYDNLSRMSIKDIPGTTTLDVYYAYDNLGRTLSARHGSTGGGGVIMAYDALSRLTSETTFGQAVSYQYDAGSRRTRVTHPDAFYAQYDYDTLGLVTAVRENGASSGVGVLATYAYDNLGRRTSVTRGNGTVTSYGYDAVSRLNSLTQNLSGTAQDNTDTFTFTPASQIATFTRSNDATYAWTSHYNVTRNYTNNGLNQHTAAGGLSLSYDTRGNLTGDGTWTYGYDPENRLTSTSGGASATLGYDPLGRLRQTAAGTTTVFLYSGQNLALEYNSAATTILRRYVHGPGTDEPIIWYEGSATTDRRFLHADTRGSIIAASNGSGTSIATYRYGPYGEPDSTTGARFRYTGQILIHELGLYHYKARTYSPWLGRFLQTDPIGYQDGMNLYAYVGNDPVNSADPSGLSGASGKYASCGGKQGFQGMCADSGIVDPTINVYGKSYDPCEWLAICSTDAIRNFVDSAANFGSQVSLPDMGSNSGNGKKSNSPQNKQCPAPAGGQSAIPSGAGAKSASEAAAIARQIANEELARTQRITDNYRLGGHNDIFDAERHARWVYRMSVAIGSGWAGLFATAHEGEGMLGGQPFNEMQMDVSNNSLGMNAAINGTGIPTRSTPGLTYIRNGQLVRKGC